MPVDEKKHVHIRFRKGGSHAKKLRRIVKKTHRSLQTEAELAIDQYKPRMVKFRDNGR